MKCPTCTAAGSLVVNSRVKDGYVRRRRQCAAGGCGVRWSTVEVVIPEGFGEQAGRLGLRALVDWWDQSIKEVTSGQGEQRADGADGGDPGVTHVAGDSGQADGADE